MQKIVVAGGSGFLGRSLRNHLSPDDWEMVVLTRHPGPSGPNTRTMAWDGRRVGEWATALDGARAVVNLTGRSINCRFTEENRELIRASRLDSVYAIGEAIRRCAAPPPVWIQAGAVGYYGDSGDRTCDEETAPGSGFVADVCCGWEEACKAEQVPATRKVILRIGPVLGRGGGALEMMTGLVRRGLGGAAGNGKQWLSWIHVRDLSRMIVWGLTEPTVVGAYNATAPHPLQNGAFMSRLRRDLGVWFGPPAPALAVQWGSRFLGVDPSLALEGQRCPPVRALSEGFRFEHPDLDGALADLLLG
jgi:uncharacterized protein